jgi:hypothetical protein
MEQGFFIDKYLLYCMSVISSKPVCKARVFLSEPIYFQIDTWPLLITGAIHLAASLKLLELKYRYMPYLTIACEFVLVLVIDHAKIG